jgi:hypothetical protein
MRAFQMLATCGVALTLAAAATAQIDWKKVDATLGKTAPSRRVHRYGFPRSDLQVMVDGVAIKPALGGRLGGLPADAWRSDGDGRPGAA